MDSYEEIYKSICRICLKYGNNKNMVSLIDNNCDNSISNYGKAVSTFANIKIQKHDYLPSYMCTKCLYLLKQAIYFKLLCENSNKKLQKLAESVETEKLKEHIVEYTMFKYYFPKDRFKGTKKMKHKTRSQSKKGYNNNHIDENDITNINTEDEYLYETESLNQDITKDNELLDKMESLIDTSAYNSLETENPVRVKIKSKHKYRKHLLVMKSRLEYNKDEDTASLVCNICNKVLRNQLTYKHHMQRHNGCRYICEHCGKGFPVFTELQIHQVSRHGTGPYLQCSTCSFKAPRKFDLIEHERLHSGERPYTCEKCGLTFRRRGIWKKHLIYHTEKKVQCPQCPKKFYQRSAMLAHANSIHDRLYVYLCSKCGATYAKTATVRRHMTERHGIPREMQGKIVRVNKSVGCQEQ